MLSKMIYIKLFLAVAFMAISCNEEPQIAELNPAEEERVRKIGQKAADRLLYNLQNKLKTTISSKGMSEAISVCNYSAMDLTDSIRYSENDIIEVKRTSFRYRNSENAPDEREQEALKYFQRVLFHTGKLPEDYIEKVIEDSKPQYRYYKSLVIKPLCLNCHGSADMIAPDISYRLKRLYPKDYATGYKIDQFRGVIRISISSE